MAGPLAAIIARQALSKFGDQVLPEGAKEAISIVDNPKSAITGMIKRAAEDRMKEELRKLLNVPKDQRIGQYIYNNCRDMEVRIESNAGVDIFSIDDEDFIKRFK